MKSAFELALERSGGGKLKEFSEDQKARLAEIEKRKKSKLAEAEMAKDKKYAEAVGDIMLQEQILKDYAVEVASINSRFENEKEKIREE